MKQENSAYFKNRGEWREWLEKNHEKSKEIWLIYFKKHTGKPSVTHEEAVEEALCFGWIDSRVNRLDDERFIQKYTQRSDKSVWSKINKDAAVKMIAEGKMTPAGLEKIKKAKEAGTWQTAYTSKRKLPLPPDLLEALRKNKIAWSNFSRFANSYQNMYIGWVTGAKRPETKSKRIAEVVKFATKNQKLASYFEEKNTF